MNFTNYMDIPIKGHVDIDFVDVHVDGDNQLYIDPERILLSDHPFAGIANEAIEDFSIHFVRQLPDAMIQLYTDCFPLAVSPMRLIWDYLPFALAEEERPQKSYCLSFMT